MKAEFTQSKTSGEWFCGIIDEQRQIAKQDMSKLPILTPDATADRME